MGFRIRKSFKLFPGVKVNLSKKGLGLSAGVKGFRVNSKGNVNIGTGPITYQTNLKSAKTPSQKNSSKFGFLKLISILFIVFFIIKVILKI